MAQFVADLVRTPSVAFPRVHAIQAAVLYARCETLIDAAARLGREDDDPEGEPNRIARRELQAIYTDLVDAVITVGGDVVRLDHAIVAVFVVAEFDQPWRAGARAASAAIAMRSRCRRVRAHVQIGLGLGSLNSFHIGGVAAHLHHVVEGDALLQASAACAAIGRDQTAIWTTPTVKLAAGRVIAMGPAKTGLYAIGRVKDASPPPPTLTPDVDVSAYLRPFQRQAIERASVRDAVAVAIAVAAPRTVQRLHELVVLVQARVQARRGQIVTIGTETDALVFQIGFGLPPDLDRTAAHADAAAAIDDLAASMTHAQMGFAIGAERGPVYCDRFGSCTRAFIIIHGPAWTEASRMMSAGRTVAPHIRFGPCLEQQRQRRRDDIPPQAPGIYAGFGSDARELLRRLPGALSTHGSVCVAAAHPDRPFSLWIAVIRDLIAPRGQAVADAVAALCPDHPATRNALLAQLCGDPTLDQYNALAALVADLVAALIGADHVRVAFVIDAGRGLDVTTINILRELVQNRQLPVAAFIGTQECDPLLASLVPNLRPLGSFEHAAYAGVLSTADSDWLGVMLPRASAPHGYALARLCTHLVSTAKTSAAEMRRDVKDDPDPYLHLAQQLIHEFTDRDRTVLARIASASSSCRLADLESVVLGDDTADHWVRLSMFFDCGLILQTAVDAITIVHEQVRTLLLSSWTESELVQIRRGSRSDRIDLSYVRDLPGTTEPAKTEAERWRCLALKPVMTTPVAGWRYGLSPGGRRLLTPPGVAFLVVNAPLPSSTNQLVLRLILQHQRRARTTAKQAPTTRAERVRRWRPQPTIVPAEQATPCGARDARLSRDLQAQVGAGIDLKVFHHRCPHRSHHRVAHNRQYMPRAPSLLPRGLPPHCRPGSALATVARQMCRRQGIGAPVSQSVSDAVSVEVRLLDPVSYQGWRLQRSRSKRTLILCGTQ